MPATIQYPNAIEAFFTRNAKALFIICLGCFIIFSGLLFNTKLFLIGDDADYIMDGYHFIYYNTYPGNRSSLYGMVLGIIIRFAGMNILTLKVFSLECAVAALWLLYITFRGRIPYWQLFTMLFITAINSSILYYSSSNLSEAFFMMMQGIYLHAVFLLVQKQETSLSFRTLWPYWLYLGAAGWLLSLSKNIAVVAPLTLPLYFLLKKEYRNAALATACFMVFKIPYEFLIRFIYGGNTGVSQIDQVLAKDLYHPELGREDAGGFITRFFKNAGIYFSGAFFDNMGISVPHTSFVYIICSTLIVLICGYGIWIVRKQNRFLLLTGIYLGIMMGASFIALQPQVAQARIIIIYMPLLLGLFLCGLCHLLHRFVRNKAFMLTAVAGGLLWMINFAETVWKAKDNVPVLQKNLGPDPLYGYTPDLVNYVKIGRFVANTLPDSIVVAARKPNSLSVYSGGRFYHEINHLPANATADTLLQELAKNHVRYLVLASLRQNPNINNGSILNALHRYAAVIAQKYPNRVKTVMRIGDTEPCYLVQIIY